jgi:hypothetical protein
MAEDTRSADVQADAADWVDVPATDPDLCPTCVECERKLERPRVSGRPITMADGRQYVFPPLRLGDQKMLAPQLARLNTLASGRPGEDYPEAQVIEDLVAVCATALGRNYPELALPANRAFAVARGAAIKLQDRHAQLERLAAGGLTDSETDKALVIRMAQLLVGALKPGGADLFDELIDGRNLFDILEVIFNANGFRKAPLGEAARRAGTSP